MSTMIRPALSLLVLMTLITGVAYPLVVTGVAQVAFPDQANGSLVRDAGGKVRGSSLIAQDFVGDAWFHPRPSAGAFATVSSSASNLSPSNPALATRVIDDASKQLVPGQGPVPLAMLTTSGSGLDPHLPPAAIAYQLARVAAARNLPVSTLQQLMNAHIEQPLVGPPVVNVLALNIALENL
ncbi:MAG: potassium-transporting ATPase subunit KdpC [Gammaproteobacteria bacterium]|uniref:potassium-transporting ATPase subunit KdpC n=1 Tax=Pseudomonas TaxID=286 RepID=UPI001C8284FA|nr:MULTISPECIES: potassium-transporting ATPase subunit KdpC [Pseudomonas]MBU0521359.1 potassium-transporting ATPase subunit KdpC [Gammaproteobacteria bacterium]MBU0820799.1 potassium-transporting ATPase subunit KdpC [Gammaproteobacteria bacterium]MBU0841373.1 potassium-transporting ATPase subunit KdpC [Gammaproteobacteria bacterium]MBU1840498.1 potassium-transporting ATPase subunit KdpC [Gammaproteobacteria bacterium]MDO8404840.1 potassium-transporting ATPase subunit KdpC [Pseudomonas sp.]